MSIMALKDFYKKLKNKADFAKRCDITPAYLWQVAHGLRRPSPGLAARMERNSNFELNKLDLLYPNE